MKESNMSNLFQNNSGNINSKNNNISVFNNITKFIDGIMENISKIMDSKFLNEKISEKLNEIDTKQIDIILMKDNLNNTLIQYYITKELINIELIITIVNYYNNILLDNKENFNKWLTNDNSENYNIFELIIEKEFSLNNQILLFNNLFNYININDKSLISKILYNRNHNIFHLCVIHNDIPLLLFLYEKIKNLMPSINILDIKNNEGMTSLHLSCFYSNKNLSDNLLLLNCNINEKDKNGNTSLHYAVKGGNVKLAKKLILFGADKYSRNEEYFSPKDIARKGPNFSMKEIFKKKMCNNNYSSIRDKRRENILLIMLTISLIIKVLFFIKKYIGNKKIDSIYIIYIISYVLDAICYGFIFYPKICSKKLYKKKNNKNDYKLLNKQIKFEDIYRMNNYDLDKIEQLCPLCKIIKKSGTKHCIICNKCIENWDHHCYWLNICINKETYNLFLSFVIILFLVIVFNIIIYISISFNIKIFNPKLNYLNTVLFVGILGFILVLLCGVFSLVRQFNQINRNRKIDKQRILSLEDLLSDSSSSKNLTENLNKSSLMHYSKYKDINTSKLENSSIEFQEFYN